MIQQNKVAFDFINYLTIEALEDGVSILFTNDIEYGIDGCGWVHLPKNTYTPPFKSGQLISFRGELTPTSQVGIGTFKISKKCNLKGNCMSMLFGDNTANNFSLSDKNYAFSALFEGCDNIISVSDDFLPATTLASCCYSNMFRGCTSLTTAPELPATTLASSCYSFMFLNCINLTSAPELPATTLASSCYSHMFYKCTSLTTAPALPATTLANYCYEYMFSGCKKLTYIKMLATKIYSNSLTNWVNGVASTGTFVKNPAMTSLPTGTSGIPRGWTVVNVENGLTFPVTLYGTNLGTANDDLGIRVYNFIKNTKSSGDYLTESEVIAINATDGSRSETLYVQMVIFNENENQILLKTNNDYWRCVLWDDGVLNTDYD